MRLLSLFAALSMLIATASFSVADVLINELQSNPPGTDPGTTSVELLGTPGNSFSGVLVFLEGEAGGGPGQVNDNNQQAIFSISGTFDGNGLLNASIPDFENPTFTAVLTDSFTGSGSTNIDVNADGIVDNTTGFGNILDAVGVHDFDANNFVYGRQLGGTDLANVGDPNSPQLIFRDSANPSVWYQLDDQTGIATGTIFTADGVPTDGTLADGTTTLGSPNGTGFTAIAQPGEIGAGDIIAFQDFEGELVSTAAGNYAATDSAGGVLGATNAASGTSFLVPTTDDDGDFINVTSSGVNGALGYTTVWTDTRTDGNETGLSDGDNIGVVNDAETLAAYQGSKWFVHEDSDGTLTTTFDTVDLSNYEDVTVSALVGVNDTGFEAADILEVYVDTNLGRIDLYALTEGDDLEDGALAGIAFEDFMATFSAQLSDDVTEATLVFNSSGSSGSELFGIDRILFNGTQVLVPEPGSLLLFCLGGLSLWSYRRLQKKQTC